LAMTMTKMCLKICHLFVLHFLKSEESGKVTNWFKNNYVKGRIEHM
jgi:hypothetical protein